MTGLRASELLFLHAQLARHLGAPPGVADTGALVSALAEAAAGEGGLFEQAASLASAVARRRPFAAANLAVAAAAAGLLLRRYDLDVQLVPADAPALRALLTRGDRAALADWLRAHTGPRPMD